MTAHSSPPGPGDADSPAELADQAESAKEGGTELGDLLDRLAGEGASIERREHEGGVDYLRAGRLFAARQGSEAHFRLRPEIVRAALTTPGAVTSARGREWVALTADRLDRFTRDRAQAWFELAWRDAVTEGQSGRGTARP